MMKENGEGDQSRKRKKERKRKGGEVWYLAVFVLSPLEFLHPCTLPVDATFGSLMVLSDVGVAVMVSALVMCFPFHLG